MKYKNAPIKEAVFDIRVEGISKPARLIDNIHEQIKDLFPKSRKRIDFQSQIEIRDDKQYYNQQGSQLTGFIFTSKDETRQVQFRNNGFTFNMLKPYSDWSDFSNEAFRLWEIYKNDTKPKKIERIALRYINRIELPVPFENFQAYLNYVPPIPSCLPQNFSNFFLQMHVPCEQKHTTVILTETIEKPGSKYFPFLLDIDIYQIGEMSQSTDELRKHFEILRVLKNNVFEDCITDNSRQLFN